MGIYVQVLDKAVCILYCANILRKSMNPTNFPPAIDK